MPRRSPDSGLDGVLCIDKPAGWTSHDVVAKARRLTGQRRMGHGGTLDPAATGLLVLLLGKATRLAEYVSAGTKVYEGIIQLGLRTTTDDLDGEVVARAPVPALDDARLASIAATFSGELLQRPPTYSAVHIGGQRAYTLARRGEAPDLPPRPITVHAMTLAPLDAEHLAIEVTCSAGTYIRSLARDIGEVLGCGAALASLRRTASGGMNVREALTLEQLASLAERGALPALLLPADEAALSLPVAIVAPGQAERLCQGSKVPGYPHLDEGLALRLYDTLGGYLGIGEVRDHLLTPHKILATSHAPDTTQP